MNQDGIRQIGVKKCLVGVLLLAAWLLSQRIGRLLAPIYSYMTLAVDTEESAYLIKAALLLVLNNVGKDVLLYISCFQLGEGISELVGQKWVEWLFPMVTIPCGYTITTYFHLFVPHFGVSAIVTMCSVWLIQYMTREMTNVGYRVTLQIALIFSVQWLDLIPALTNYGVGGGELSLAVKNIAILMREDRFFNTIFTFISCTNMVFSVLLSELFIGYEKRFMQLDLLRQKERELVRIREQQAQDRLYREIQYLVHDLKRPLTTILGLGDILAISNDKTTASHGKTISSVAEKMDMMISEIKDPMSTHNVKVADVIDYAMSQVMVLSWGNLVSSSLKDGVENAVININLIRFSRVLVNLLDNAWHATLNIENPYIDMSVSLDGAIELLIKVSDNGPGFSKKQDSATWGSGFGLEFVRKAVLDMNGRLSHVNRPEGGACFSIWMPVKKGGVRH